MVTNRFAGASFALVLLATAAAAEPLTRDKVPEPLKPWVDWALRGHEQAECPSFQERAEVSRCAWPSRLSLELDERGGKFSQSWHLVVPTWVTLPGDAKRWPQNVTIDARPAGVTPRDGLPSIRLEKGEHTLAGAFLWDSMPEALQVPAETGLLSLFLRGARIEQPNRDTQGLVYLQKTAAPEEGERLEVTVHRKVTDEVPLLLTTRVQLNVSGRSREVVLGRALPDGFVPLSLSGPLPARLEPDSRLRVQVRPGSWTLELVARSEAPVAALARPDPQGLWREGEEVWVFESRNDLRQVTVEGPPALDPQQTTLPDEWKRLPAFPMKLGETVKLVEKRRGDADPAPDQLTLNRQLWLDFDGRGFTVSDTVTGQTSRAWRLEMANPTQLGRVSVGGQDVFITQTPDSKGQRTGVEVRHEQINVTADSRIDGDASNIPAVGWAHDFHQVTGMLHLPAGWKLFHATGVDDVSSTWLKHWTLLQLFLALIVAIAVARLYGLRWGAVALVTAALVFPEADSPRWSWLWVLGFEALLRVLPQGRPKTAVSFAKWSSFAILLLISVDFLVDHVRHGMYPALEQPWRTVDVSASTPVAQAAFAQNQEQDQDQDIVYDRKVDLLAGLSSSEPLARKADKAGKKDGWYEKARRYDPNSVVQTGPGLPRWQWTNVSLRWSGPVESTQRLKLWLLSPGVNLFLAFARLFLVAAMLLCLLRLPREFWTSLLRGGRGPAKAAGTAALGLFVALGAGTASAQEQTAPAAQVGVPLATPTPPLPPMMLEQLAARLLERPDCVPTCAASPRLLLEARPRLLRLRLEVAAAAATAVPLPGSASTWTPDQVVLDGQPARGLLHTPDGVLWVELSPGSHQLVLEGPLPPRETVQLPLPLKPHRVEATTDGWTLEGLHEDGLADDNLQLTRARGRAGGELAALQASALPPFVRVERLLLLGLTWEAETRVVRVSPTGSAVVLEIPLLPGESVVTADVRVVNGRALLNMGPQQTEATWRSVLEPRSPIVLTAPKALPWTEVWQVDVGPVWHAALSGVPVVHRRNEAGARLPEWRPWPGEQASLDISRPEGVSGQTLTIDSAMLTLSPGVRSTDAQLSVTVRSSRGGQHAITLPENAQLTLVQLNGATQPIRQDGRKVTLPLSPGAQHFSLSWRQSNGVTTLFRGPQVDLGVPSVNTEIRLNVPASRWVLFLGGPRVGPAVQFWAFLVVLLAVAIGLGRVRSTPLRTWHWVLLGIGLSQVPVVAAAVVAGWLLLLGWRQRKGAITESVVQFDAVQLLVAGTTVIALAVLAYSIRHGLLGQPDMQIAGNGSGHHVLRWYQDRSTGVLPEPWMVSVPLWVYRGVMLAWALWCALSLVRWLRWGWEAFTTGGGWRKLPKKPAPTVATATRLAPPAPPAPPAAPAP